MVPPAILPAKKLLQDLCKQNIDWDDEIGEDERKRWENWLFGLTKLSEITLEQCIKPEDFGRVKRCSTSSLRRRLTHRVWDGELHQVDQLRRQSSLCLSFWEVALDTC